MNTAERKHQLRQQARAQRTGLEPIELEKASAHIRRNLRDLPAYQQAEAILTYVSLKEEPDTHELIRDLIRKDRTVLVPVMQPGSKLAWCALHSWEDLHPGPRGILIPHNTTPTPTGELGTALCLVPGLLFDTHGHRLGYGGGYFDRFLATFPGVCAGLVMSPFLVPELPRAPHDVPVRHLVTENSVLDVT